MPEHLYATDNTDFEHLLSQGFSEIEASRIVYMKTHILEQVEYREWLEETRHLTSHLSFLRWLVEHNRISR